MSTVRTGMSPRAAKALRHGTDRLGLWHISPVRGGDGVFACARTKHGAWNQFVEAQGACASAKRAILPISSFIRSLYWRC